MAFNNSNNLIPMDLTNTPTTPSMTISSTIGKTIPLENRTPIMATFISLYALIFFFGITGNALVVCKYRFCFHFNVEKKIISFASCCLPK
jgi:hypothetical protein